MSSLSISQTYLLANKVQAKLQREAQKPDLNLRLLLLHAHLLDNIIGHLSSARTTSTAPESKKEATPLKFSFYDEESDDESVFEDSEEDEDSYIEYYDASYKASPRQVVTTVREITSDEDSSGDELLSDDEKILSDCDNSDSCSDENCEEEEVYGFNYVTTSGGPSGKNALIRSPLQCDHEVDIQDFYVPKQFALLK